MTRTNASNTTLSGLPFCVTTIGSTVILGVTVALSMSQKNKSSTNSKSEASCSNQNANDASGKKNPADHYNHNNNSTKRIFVSIASYRDPDTPNTLRDLFLRASYPDRVFAGVLWQVNGGEEDAFLERPHAFRNQVRGIIVDARNSQGACWARSRIQQELYQGEDYYYMVDSHSRFVDGWDERFIDMLEFCRPYSQYNKPVLSTYPCGFTPPRNFRYKDHLPTIIAGEFNDRGCLLFRTKSLGYPDKYPNKPHPLPAHFIGANCFFSDGHVVANVPYDPHLYFHGEEITYSVRLYTHGYDLYTPNDCLMYHDYTPTDNTNRTRHWDDHLRWREQNAKSFRRVRYVLGSSTKEDKEKGNDDNALVDIEKYGLGRDRSLVEYEKYAKVSFSKRTFLLDSAGPMVEEKKADI